MKTVIDFALEHDDLKVGLRNYLEDKLTNN
jgi:hypothetical protein